MNKDQNTNPYLEIDATAIERMITETSGGSIEINGISLESATDEKAVIELKDDKSEMRYKVELRLSPNNLPLAKCGCWTKGKPDGCNHITKALYAFAALSKLNLAVKITKKSQQSGASLYQQKG